jgi:hypothetical protein
MRHTPGAVGTERADRPNRQGGKIAEAGDELKGHIFDWPRCPHIKSSPLVKEITKKTIQQVEASRGRNAELTSSYYVIDERATST